MSKISRGSSGISSRGSSTKSSATDATYLEDDLPRRKIVVVGDGAAGKTSLIYRMIKGIIPEDYVPTIMENSVAKVEAQTLKESPEEAKQRVIYTYNLYASH